MDDKAGRGLGVQISVGVVFLLAFYGLVSFIASFFTSC